MSGQEPKASGTQERPRNPSTPASPPEKAEIKEFTEHNPGEIIMEKRQLLKLAEKQYRWLKAYSALSAVAAFMLAAVAVQGYTGEMYDARVKRNTQELTVRKNPSPEIQAMRETTREDAGLRLVAGLSSLFLLGTSLRYNSEAGDTKKTLIKPWKQDLKNS